MKKKFDRYCEEYNEKCDMCYGVYLETYALFNQENVTDEDFNIIMHNFNHLLAEALEFIEVFDKYNPPKEFIAFKTIIITKFYLLRGEIYAELDRFPPFDFRAEVFENYYKGLATIEKDIFCLAGFAKEDKGSIFVQDKIYQSIIFLQTYWDEPIGVSFKKKQKELLSLEKIFLMLAEINTESFIKLISYKNSLSIVPSNVIKKVYSDSKDAYTNFYKDFKKFEETNIVIDVQKVNYIHANISRCLIEIKLYPDIKEKVKINNKKQQAKNSLVESLKIAFNAINTYILPAIEILKTIDFNTLIQSREFIEFNKIIYEIFNVLITEIYSLNKIINQFTGEPYQQFYKNIKELDEAMDEFFNGYDPFINNESQTELMKNVSTLMGSERKKVKVIVNELDAKQIKIQTSNKKMEEMQVSKALKLEKELDNAEWQKATSAANKKKRANKKAKNRLLLEEKNKAADPIIENESEEDEPTQGIVEKSPEFVQIFLEIFSLRKNGDFQEAAAQYNKLKNKGIADKNNKLIVSAMEHLVGMQAHVINLKLKNVKLLLTTRLSGNNAFSDDDLNKLQQSVLDVFIKLNYLKNLETEYFSLANTITDNEMKDGITLVNNSIKIKMDIITKKAKEVKAIYNDLLIKKSEQKKEKQRNATVKIQAVNKPKTLRYYQSENQILNLLEPYLRDIATFNEQEISSSLQQNYVNFITLPVQEGFNELNSINKHCDYYLTGSAAADIVLKSLKKPGLAFKDLDFIGKGKKDRAALIVNGFSESGYIDGLYSKNTGSLPIDLTILGENQSIEESLFKRDLSICKIAIAKDRSIIIGSLRTISDLINKYLYLENPVDVLDKDPVIIIRVIKFMMRGFRCDPDLLNAIYNWQPNDKTNFIPIKLVIRKLFKYSTNEEKKDFVGDLIAYGLLEKMFKINYEGNLDQVVSVVEFQINNTGYGLGKHPEAFFNDDSREPRTGINSSNVLNNSESAERVYSEL